MAEGEGLVGGRGGGRRERRGLSGGGERRGSVGAGG